MYILKKVLKITGACLLILFLLIILLTSILAISNWDIIKAGYIGFVSTPNKIGAKIDKSQETMQHNIEKYTGITFRAPTAEEQEQIDSGKKTKAEVFETILDETIEEYIKKNEESSSSPNKQTPAKNNTDKPSSGVPEEDTKEKKYNQIVASYTSRLYSIKGSYMGKLESLLTQADNEFHALPQKQWTKANRSRIISKYIGVASGYESACDSEVNSLLSSMKSELESIGADTSIVSAMKEVYYEEKSLKISYYMSQMK